MKLTMPWALQLVFPDETMQNCQMDESFWSLYEQLTLSSDRWSVAEALLCKNSQISTIISFPFKKLWQLKLQQSTTNCYSERASVLISGRQESRRFVEKDWVALRLTGLPEGCAEEGSMLISMRVHGSLIYIFKEAVWCRQTAPGSES